MARVKKSLENPQVLAQQTDIQHIKEIIFVASLIVAMFFFVALVTYAPSDDAWNSQSGTEQTENAVGITGAWVADISLSLFGVIGFSLPILLVLFAWQFYRQELFNLENIDVLGLKLVGFVMLISSTCGLSFLFFEGLVTMPQGVGGIIGSWVGGLSVNYGSSIGATLGLWLLFFVGSSLFANISWVKTADILGAWALSPFRLLSILWFKYRASMEKNKAFKTKAKRQQTNIEYAKILSAREAVDITPQTTQIQKSTRKASEAQASLFDQTRVDPNFSSAGDGSLPPINLLNFAPEIKTGYSEKALQMMSRQVEIKLKDFNVAVEVVGVQPGPVVTRFEFMPAPGIKASKITGLATDLARSLSQVSVRVVEVIPGKSVIGLEVPNEHRQIVYLSEIIGSKLYEQSKSPLTLALGKDIAGNPVIADLAKMPHVLVAGTTGSGKSVCVNTMVLSLLYKATPDDVRMIMVDPKMLELSVYEDIPHLLTPVVTDMNEASNALRWSVAEMERRYKLMSKLGVRNLAGYNKKVEAAIKAGAPIDDPTVPEGIEPRTLEKLPYIVVLIDEFADMIMVVGKKIEELIVRLAQKARAAGIHLVLATQRPSVDVITGLIKSNIPTRMAFQVSSKMDSRVILDQMGAEQLLGKGDMLYLPPGQAFAERVHGALVDDDEVHKVVEFLKERYETNYIEEITQENAPEIDGTVPSGDTGGEADDLYDKAVKVVLKTGKASTSGVQRHLHVGYNRAARLVEAMEKAGLVSPPSHNGQREIIVPRGDSHE